MPSAIATMTRTVAYERAGIGGSEPGPEPRSVKQIVAELHTLLAKLEVPPPIEDSSLTYHSPITFAVPACSPGSRPKRWVGKSSAILRYFGPRLRVHLFAR